MLYFKKGKKYITDKRKRKIVVVYIKKKKYYSQMFEHFFKHYNQTSKFLFPFIFTKNNTGVTKYFQKIWVHCNLTFWGTYNSKIFDLSDFNV